jgi:hypothetical protein
VALAFVRTEPSRVTSSVAPAIASSGAPWCIARIGKKDMSDCHRISFTGEAPACVLSAECEGSHVSLDCATAGAGWCRCDGPNGARVPYDASFCALDPDSASKSLHTMLDRGAVACRWTSPQ